MSDEERTAVRLVIPEPVVEKLSLKIMAPEPSIEKMKIKIIVPGASDHVIARPTDERPFQFDEARYLCSRCGQEGAIDRYALTEGGTVECPECGDVMGRVR